MILVKCPDDYFRNEREYIYDVILDDFLGLDYELVFEKRDDLCMTFDDKELSVEDTFFNMSPEDYLKSKSMPRDKLDCWECHNKDIAQLFIENRIPVLYGRRLNNNDYIDIQSDKIRLGIDVFGSAFFMLTRYEEVVITERDSDDFEHFPASLSMSGKNDFVERPIINEYIELLTWLIKKISQNQSFKEKKFKMILTHDVDRPSVVLNFRDRSLHLRRLLGDLLIRRNMSLVIRRFKSLIGILRHGYEKEWEYTFDYIMDKSEKMGLKSTFFFMAHKSQLSYDGDYYIDNNDIISLIKHIAKRGHKIGIHPEFNSYNNETLIKDNVDRLRKIMIDNHIGTNEFGGRQHYLRWSPDTWQYYDDNRIAFDTTLSFADNIGFRCGICYDYPVYNLKRRTKLNLREYPLIVMEGSALVYMGLSFDESEKRIINLKNMCKKYNGNFVLLWHNDMFLDERLNKLYDRILRG